MITDYTSFSFTLRFYENVFCNFMLALANLSVVFFEYSKSDMFYEVSCLFRRRCRKIKINPFHSSFYDRFIIFMGFKVAQTEVQYLYCALNRFMLFAMRTMRAQQQ